MSARQHDWRTAILFALVAAAGLAALPPALSHLRNARLHRAAMVVLSRVTPPRPQPLVADGVAFVGARREADVALRSAIRDLATREGALVERIGVVPPLAPDLVARHAIVSGSPRAILRLVEAIESRSPVARWSRYRLATTASGRSLLLEGDVVMAFTTS